MDTGMDAQSGTRMNAQSGADMNAALSRIGTMPMPADFKYRKIHEMGRPRHEKYSDFWCKHIPMDRTHRAKIFAPFDALDGFDEAIEAAARKSADSGRTIKAAMRDQADFDRTQR